MGGTYKKTLRAEKAKVKLKGIKLPKGLNVTKTDFKVRKIAIREQLKESQYLEGQRQVNLKEILTRLKHHSSNFRLDALRNLREAILAGHSAISGQLSNVIQGVAAISLDLDRHTRRESFKVLSTLLAALTGEATAPFFHIISSYLRCAMTHIQPSVQEDALLMLDVLLQHVPHLVATHSDRIFQNFLEMISRVRADGDRASRTLTVQMGNKQTTVKWRFKVLERLQQMLQTLVDYNRVNSDNAAAATGGSKRSHQLHTFNAKEPQYYSLKRTFAAQCDISEIFCRTVGNENTLNSTPGSNTTADETLIVRGYVEHLMPLLLEAWLEVRPQEAAGGAQVILSHDAALSLKVILEIMENLWSLVEIHESKVRNNDLSEWFQQEYGEAFVNGFLQQTFPYQQTETAASDEKAPKRAKKTTSAAGGQFCVAQNINLTHLMCNFYSQRIKEQSKIFSALLKYLNTIVSNLQTCSTEYSQQLEPSLRIHLLQNGIEFLTHHATEARLLLRSTIDAFLNIKFSSRDGVSARVLVLLCDIVQKQDLFNAYGGAEFGDLLAYLPQLLLKPSITEAALLSMSSLGKQRNAKFLHALQERTVLVIENIVKIQVTGAHNAFEGKKHIMNLFYWIEKDYSPEQKEALVKKIVENITDKRIVGYFKFVLACT